MRPTGLRPAILFLLGATALAACGNQLSLLPAVYENRVDTLTLWAASNTPVAFQSGYVIGQRLRVRLDRVSSFDFLYDVDAKGEHIFLPLAALVNTGRTTSNPGFLSATTPFDSITVGPQVGYITNDTVRATAGQVFFLHSQLDPNCTLGIPYYAKMQVLSFNDSTRSVYFRILANVNCGYRSLQLGLPKT